MRTAIGGMLPTIALLCLVAPPAVGGTGPLPGFALRKAEDGAVGCTDESLLEEERSFLTGSAGADTSEETFWASPGRRPLLAEWAARVESVRSRGLALDDARALGTLLYGPPMWTMALGDVDTADGAVCSVLRPLVVEGFTRPRSAADRERVRGRPATEGDRPDYLVTLRGDDGALGAWSRVRGLASLVSPLSPLSATAPQGFADDRSWSEWREVLRREIDRSGCLGDDFEVLELLLDALANAARPEDLALDLAELRDPAPGAGRGDGSGPEIRALEASSLVQGDARILGARVTLGTKTPGARPARMLIRFHVFDESGVARLDRSVSVEPGPNGELPTLGHWLGSAPPGRYCIVARAYDLRDGRASAPLWARSVESSVEAAELGLELAWSEVGSEVAAAVSTVRSDVWAVGFRVEGGDWVWSRGPSFEARVPVDPARLDVTVQAVAVDSDRRVLTSSESRLESLPRRSRVRLRTVRAAGLGGDGLGVVVEVDAAEGRPVESVELVVDGAAVESRLAPPYLFSLTRRQSRPGAVVEARARFEGGSVLDGALVLGSPGVLQDEVEVRLLELPFQLRRGGRGLERPLAADDVVVRLGDHQRAPDRLLFEDSLALRAMLLVDVSGTMLEEQSALAEALDRFARSLKPTDEVGLVEFREQARVVLPLSARKEPLVAAVEDLAVGGGTAVWDAVATAVVALPAGIGRRAVVLLSDGLDEHSQLDPATIADLLDRARVALYVVHVEKASLLEQTVNGAPRQKARMQELHRIRARLGELAHRSGGSYCFAVKTRAIGSCLNEFADDLRKTYLAVVRLDEGEGDLSTSLSLRPGVGARLEKR